MPLPFLNRTAIGTWICPYRVSIFGTRYQYLQTHEFATCDKALKDSLRCGYIDRGVCGLIYIYPALALPRPIVVPPDLPSAMLSFLDIGPNVEKWLV